LDETPHTRTPAEEDASTEAAVLHELLALHPVQITLDELIREMVGGAGSFDQRDAIGRAVRDLTGAGLLHRSGGLVFPSRAAFRFSELLDS
jgi:hypothetical protein